MATTKKQPVKKAVVNKQAAKKVTAKKVAAKKAEAKDEKGKKLSEIKFTVYENGVMANGEIGIKGLIEISNTIHHMIGERMNGQLQKALSISVKAIESKKQPAKKAK